MSGWVLEGGCAPRGPVHGDAHFVEFGADRAVEDEGGAGVQSGLEFCYTHGEWLLLLPKVLPSE